jgi:hypothetical protein
MSLLQKYEPRKFDDETISHRPTYRYYIGYYLYRSIIENGKLGDLQKAINHPELLFDLYNQCWNEKSLIPKFPMKINNLWKTNIIQEN